MASVTIPSSNIEILDSSAYTVIRIPKQARPVLHSQDKKPRVADLVGALKNVPDFQNKTSVEVEDMMYDSWADNILNKRRS